MKPSLIPKTLLFVIATTGLAISAFAGPLETVHWKYHRTVGAGKGPADLPRSVAFDGEVVSHAKLDGSDVRIVDAEGQERPLVIRTRPGQTLDRKLPHRVVYTNLTGDKTEIVIELTAKNSFNRVRMVPKQFNFFRRVDLEASDDGSSWVPVRKGMIVYAYAFTEKSRVWAERLTGEAYRYEALGHYSGENCAFRIPKTQSRYLKLTVPHGKDKEPVELKDLEVFRTIRMRPRQMRFDARILSTRTLSGNQQEIQLDLGLAQAAVSRIDLATHDQNFFRKMNLEISEDQKNWTPVGEGDVFSVSLEGSSTSRLFLEFPEVRGRYLKVRVDNGDNRPIRWNSFSAEGLRRYAVFLSGPGQKDEFLYGNLHAKAPVYDLGRVLAERPFAGFERVELGPEKLREGYRPGGPWTDDKPYLIWIAMALIGAVILSLVLRMAKKIS